MFGLMQDRPLLISSLIEHASAFHPAVEIVSKTVEGDIHRTNWIKVRSHAKQVANALESLGVRSGDRVATLAWNSYRHLALYYGVSGSGAVLHTINPRLFPDQINYIVNHAEDSVLFFDVSFAPLIEKLATHMKTVRHFIAMTDRAHMPKIDVPNLVCFDELVDAQSDEYEWPEFDERTASSLCYTSGTTGNPKGVLYSHRSLVIQALMEIGPDALNLSARTTVLLIVPMFHANAWCVPYAAAMTGTKLVMAGPHMDGGSVYALMRDETVTFSMAVPTVWMMLLQYLDQHPELDARTLGVEKVSCGGSAPPRAMIERLEQSFGAEFSQGWGMTELSPCGAIYTPLPKHASLTPAERLDHKLKQGRGIWGVEMKIVNEEGHSLPWDGKAFGRLLVRGPCVASGYYKEEGQILQGDWFDTGDVATIDADGFLQLVDRAKDVIKSGGEWISSIDLESAASGHPAVTEAAVIGAVHPKWQERPLLLITLRPGLTVTREEMLVFLADRVAKWWLPDDVIVVNALPHTATGKLLKTKLREQYSNHLLAINA